jgi:16S rRNA (cytosine967-C5)-methyltransferase
MAKLQAELLTQLLPLLKPGGCLMYCTCSVFKQEGQQPIESFLENNNSVRLLASPGHLIPKSLSAQAKLSQNTVIDQDGFYYAILHKPAAPLRA